MRRQILTVTIASGLLVAAAPVLADHNSKNGEGWANMPNDIHNTRVETIQSGDQDEFKDFVKNGEGSKSVNRFESDETQPGKAMEQKGQANMAKNGGEPKAQNKNKVETKAGVKDRNRIETRTRLNREAASRVRPERSAGSRQSNSRRGGGKR